MKLLDYINGQRKGKDAHRIEKESMKDPFLYEAIEGFDSIDDDHSKRIADIHSRFKQKAKTGDQSPNVWRTVAASVIILLGVGGYFLSDYHKSELQAREMPENAIIDIYVPEAYYTENMLAIAQKNAELVKIYKSQSLDVARFNIENTDNTIITEEEQRLLAESINDDELINIYIPEEFSERSDIQATSENGKPEPVIGYERYNEYLKKSLRRPTDDRCKDRTGKVAIEFSVNSLGQPFLFDVKYSLCGTSDNEAIRLIQSGPRWTTGSAERVTVKVEF